jgi:hypothetical protein
VYVKDAAVKREKIFKERGNIELAMKDSKEGENNGVTRKDTFQG